nr:PepSY-associated TM helix domain-containing protein [uncultured Sediminibacterium sp.]
MEIKQTATKDKKAGAKQSEWKKLTARYSRWLHIYLSMFSFVIVLFFSVTGITLNHLEWFDESVERENKVQGTIPASWVNMSDTALIKKMEVVELLRKQYGIKGYVSDFMIQDDQCMVSFRGPGYSADAFINREDGAMQLTEMKLGVIALFNDLHKGRDSGNAWKWVIDLSAAFLIIVSLSGLVMLFFLKKKRVNGLLIALIGGLICYLIYKIWIP